MGTRPAALAGLPLLEDLPPISGKRALVRVDFNVPLSDSDGRRVVADDFRIRTALPTLQWLLEKGAQVTACSHLGRPPNAPDPQWDMAPVRAALDALCPGVTLLDNLRFSPGEEDDDPHFVDALVHGNDVYVDEAFSVAHRRHASVVGPPCRLPSAAGLQLAREVEVLGGLLDQPARPFVAVVGGAKVGDKLGVLQALAAKVDVLAVGGAMAFTFLRALGHEVGDSLVDLDRVEDCRRLLSGAASSGAASSGAASSGGASSGAASSGAASSGGGPGTSASGARILLPTDVVALGVGGVRLVGADVPDGYKGLDVGPETADTFAEAITSAGTVLWNGPLGVVEDERFCKGTRRVAEAVAACPGFTVVGGGDSVGALGHLGLADRVDFLSTGGGASLRFVEKGDLPGLAALRGAPNAPRVDRASSRRWVGGSC